MDKIQEIEAAIESLPREDYRRIAEWFREREQQLWDAQMDEDFAEGKLDSLFTNADDDEKKGLLHEWPPAS
jgi:hypothetical protein